MNDREIKLLKNWCSKLFEQNNLSIDIFDFNAHLDHKITYEENKTILREKIKVFFNEYSSQNINNLKKIEAEGVGVAKEQYEVYSQEVNKKQEQQAQLEFYNSLMKIAETKDTILLEQKFWLLRQYVSMVCKGNANGLIVEGEAGLGKSFNILKTLKESGREFVYCSGFTTTLELYNFLYEHRKDIIFFDDSKNILRSESSLEILKAGLYSPTEKRIVRYSSSTNKLKAPREFIFEGGIIVALNDMGKFSEDLKAVVDRVLYYNVRFTYREKLQIITDLIKQDYKELTKEERHKIFEWIKDNTSEATSNLNFRLLFKLYEVYRFDKDNFEKTAKHIVRTDIQQELIIQLLKKTSSVKQAQQEWCEQTGLSRSSFYSHKAKI